MGNLCSSEINIKDGVSETKEAKFNQLYKLGERLGEGSYATVYKGQKKNSKEKFAIKKITRSKLDEEDERSMRWEIRVLQMLSHPNIIKFYGSFEELKYHYLVTELMEGGELLERVIEKDHYTEKEARDAIQNFLSAVAYMHEKKVVHRDLKPENLLLVSKHDDESLKIADFGFAEVVSKPLTCRCGTPNYMAPEMLKKEPYELTVDMWSVGVICFILLGGYPPFVAQEQKELFKKIKEGKYHFAPQMWGHISEEAKDLIRKMLTLDPDARLTAKQALNHPWVHQHDDELSLRNLLINSESLKHFNRHRRLKAAAEAVLFSKVHELAHMKAINPLNPDFHPDLDAKKNNEIRSV